MFIQPVTPPVEAVTPQHDLLIAAGSNVSLRDVFDRQMDLQLIRRKYYKAQDVDRLFILMNGILSNVSQHHHRMAQTVQTLRTENAQLSVGLSKAQEDAQEISASNIELSRLVKELQTQLGQQAIALAEKNEQIQTLNAQRQALAAHIRSLQA